MTRPRWFEVATEHSSLDLALCVLGLCLGWVCVSGNLDEQACGAAVILVPLALLSIGPVLEEVSRERLGGDIGLSNASMVHFAALMLGVVMGIQVHVAADRGSAAEAIRATPPGAVGSSIRLEPGPSLPGEFAVSFTPTQAACGLVVGETRSIGRFGHARGLALRIVGQATSGQHRYLGLLTRPASEDTAACSEVPVLIASGDLQRLRDAVRAPDAVGNSMLGDDIRAEAASVAQPGAPARR